MATVSTIHPNLENDLRIFKFISDLQNGYDGITAAKETYLPRQLSEMGNNKLYNTRHGLATYLDSFNPIVDGITGLIFQDPINIETSDSDINEFIENATPLSKNLNFFIKRYFKSALSKARSYAYVDIPAGNENAVTDVQRRAAGINPFVVFIKPDDIINYRISIIDGKETPSLIVIRETVEVQNPQNSFDVENETRYRVLKIGSVEVYDKDENLIPELTVQTGLNRIPLVELNLDEEAPMFNGRPPFLDVGRLSIDNYQLMSDSRWSANTASIPVLSLMGFDSEEAKAITISVNAGIRSSNPESSVSYLDYEGKGVALNLSLIEKIDRRIAEIGMSVLTADRQQVTATEKTIDTIQTQSKIQNWVDSLENSITQILQFVAMYYNREFNGTVEIQASILDNTLTAEEISRYSDMVSRGQLSNITLWQVLKSRNRLPEDFDPELEETRVQDQDAPFQTVGT